MKISVFTILLIFFLSNLISAQSQDSLSSKHPLRYFNSFQVGGLFGNEDSGSTFTSSTVHGLRKERVSFGIGIGYDSYLDWKVAPLFGFVSYDFVKFGKNALYVAGTGGYSKTWYRKVNEYDPKYESNGGVMINPMIGYRIAAEKWDIHISAGYKWQRINYMYTPIYYQFYDYGYSFNNYSYEVEENSERLTVQFGFGLH
jgi:hypothetical protein